jgi:hypothetical protein
MKMMGNLYGNDHPLDLTLFSPSDGAKSDKYSEDWGNQWLTNLNEVISPGDVSWMPETIGWQLLAATTTLALILIIWQRWRSWLFDAYRREAINNLQSLRSQIEKLKPHPGPIVLAAIDSLQILPTLLRRSALNAYARESVIPMTGPAWVEFLNKTELNAKTKQPVFSSSSQNLLHIMSYCSSEKLSGEDLSNIYRLLDEAEVWLRCHKRGLPGK